MSPSATTRPRLRDTEIDLGRTSTPGGDHKGPHGNSCASVLAVYRGSYLLVAGQGELGMLLLSLLESGPRCRRLKLTKISRQRETLKLVKKRDVLSDFDLD